MKKMIQSLVQPLSDRPQSNTSRSKWNVYLGLVLAAGLLVVALHAIGGKGLRELSAGILLAGASGMVGLFIGFLFGIPKIANADEDIDKSSMSRPNNQYSVNTNLQDISDWLTKMLVGVGLVQLTAMPRYLRKVAAFWEGSVGKTFPTAYTASLIVFFSATGFMIGYLWTRLALTGDFMDADPSRDIDDLVMNVTKMIDNDPNLGKRTAGQEVVSAQEIRTAESIAKISSFSGIPLQELRRRIDALARRYESIRESEPSGDERTRNMELVVSQMRVYALAAYQLLPEYTNSDSAGDRLAGIAFLEIKPDHRYYGWLTERFKDEKPFLQYHAATALRNALKQKDLSTEERQSLKANCEEALDLAKEAARSHGNQEANSDEIQVLNNTIDLLNGQHS